MISDRVRAHCRRVASRGIGATLRDAFAVRLCLPAILFGGCTLTAQEFEPDVARGEALPAPNQTGSCAAGAECCDQVGCASGLVCRKGACTIGTDPAACTGPDCPPGDPVPLEPRCSEGMGNADAPRAACGFECARLCEVGESCRTDSDCGPEAFCATGSQLCALASCSDGIQNGAELGLDCGGPCGTCPAGTACAQPSDCASGVCSSGRCAAADCSDSVLNGGEVDVDCGGACALPCADGRRCGANTDCESGVCGALGCSAGARSCCQPPTCSDGVANGDEPAVDCGNGACGLCILGEVCAADSNCETGFCDQGACADPGRCDDGVVNGRESAADCGGGTCPRCEDLSTCRVDSDCDNNNCDERGICISCGDGAVNGSETDVDCGGSDPFCQRCRDLLDCRQDSDCTNNNCDERGICISCGDGAVNGSETDVDCGGTDPFCQRCIPGQRCLIGSDCQSGMCFGGFC